MAEILKDASAVEAQNKKEGLQTVKPKEPTKVKWTGKAQHHKEGDISVVHRVQAEKLVKAGKATIVKGE